MRPGTWASVGAAVLLVAACGGGAPESAPAKGNHEAVAAQEAGAEATTTAPTTAPSAGPPSVQQLQALPLALTRVADTQMLTAIAWRTGDPNPDLADQHGMIYHLVNGRSDPVLDLTAEVMDYQAGAEYGMLGMTFDPVDGRIIFGFNGNDVDTRMVSYAVGDDGPPDPASAREILRIDKPGVGHNSGQLVIGGHVYRGRAIPGLPGAYMFMDMTGPIWAMGPMAWSELDVEAGGVQTSFGEDPDGELWLLTQQNGVFKLGPR